jgi:hypothetical protein
MVYAQSPALGGNNNKERFFFKQLIGEVIMYLFNEVTGTVFSSDEKVVTKEDLKNNDIYFFNKSNIEKFSAKEKRALLNLISLIG